MAVSSTVRYTVLVSTLYRLVCLVLRSRFSYVLIIMFGFWCRGIRTFSRCFSWEVRMVIEVFMVKSSSSGCER